MSLSIIQYPNTGVNGNKSTISKWNAVHHPIKYKLRREDFGVSLALFGPTLMKVLLQNFSGVISTILQIGDSVFIATPNGQQTFEVVGIQDNFSFFVEVGTFQGAGDPFGYCNFLSRVNYFTLLNVWEVTPSNQFNLLGSSKNRPSSTGEVDVDVSSFLKSLVDYKDDFKFDVLNQKDLMLGNRYNVTFSENWNGYAGPFSAMSETDLSYFTNSAKQIQDLYGLNMGEYVPFLLTSPDDPKAKFLSDFERPTYFEGFPFSLSFIYSEFLTGIASFKKEDKFDLNNTGLTPTTKELDNSQLPFVNRLTLDGGYTNENHVEVYLFTNEDVSAKAAIAPDYVAPGYVGGGTEIPPVDDSLVSKQQ